jgi:hypothetical protein
MKRKISCRVDHELWAAVKTLAAEMHCKFTYALEVVIRKGLKK